MKMSPSFADCFKPMPILNSCCTFQSLNVDLFAVVQSSTQYDVSFHCYTGMATSGNDTTN